MGAAQFIWMKLWLYLVVFAVTKLWEIPVVWGEPGEAVLQKGKLMGSASPGFSMGTGDVHTWFCLLLPAFALAGFSFSHIQHIHFFPLHSHIPRVSN